MDARIHMIRMGFDQCDLLQSDGVIAVDAGAPGKGNNLLSTMAREGIDPKITGDLPRPTGSRFPQVYSEK